MAGTILDFVHDVILRLTSHNMVMRWKSRPMIYSCCVFYSKRSLPPFRPWFVISQLHIVGIKGQKR